MNLLQKTAHNRKLIVFGALGQIGSRVLSAASSRGLEIQGIEWDEAPQWLKQSNELPPTDYVVAFGLTDSTLTREAHLESNLHFPQKLLRRCEGSDFRILTIGSILERFPEVCAPNPYLSSKLELSQWVRAQSDLNRGRFLHTRLHTLYSTDIKPHMFLGQVFHAIRNNQVFKMTTGEQLREYHHADDIAQSILRVLGLSWDKNTLAVEFNSGSPVKLCDLAKHLFSRFGKEHLLALGALGKAQVDNWKTRFDRSPELYFVDRDPLHGTHDVFKEKLAALDR